MRRSIFILGACLVGTSACTVDSTTGGPPPPESLMTVEAQFTCMRIVGPGGMTLVSTGVTEPALKLGDHVVHTNTEWKTLWNSARQLPDSEPPVPLPDGDIAVAVTKQASMQVHTHIKRITDTADIVSIQTQSEARKFPEICHDGRCSNMQVSDSDFIETLVVFLPGVANKQISFETLPTLVWTPETFEAVKDAPPCPYRQQ